MRSIILSTAARYSLPLLLMFSLFVLLRGHNEPGGGFVGGLVAAAGYALYALAENVQRARASMVLKPRHLVASGLIIALASGLFSLLAGAVFMEGLWGETYLPGIGKLGTPLFFDIGVYLLVVGTVTGMIFQFFEA